MISYVWISQVVFAIAAAVPGHELVPEKYLKPRDFNYHPYTDVGVAASIKKSPAPLNNPFDILDKLRTRESRDYSNDNLVYFPVPHASVLTKKIDTNELPKNYAFTYTVKDHLSGDDFSHSQAHNGKATKGQYRVKLPDGRTQIVSYTADHKGYRADVQYEDKVVEKTYVQPIYEAPSPQHVPSLPVKLPEVHRKQYHGYQNDVVAKYQYVPIESATVASPTLADSPESVDHVSNLVTSAPVHLQPGDGVLKFIVKHHGSPTAEPRYYKPVYVQQYLSTAAPYTKDQVQYTATTPAPQYAASTVSPQIRYVPSTPLYPADHASTIDDKQYRHYSVVSTTAVTPTQHAVLVTPRPLHHHSEVKALEPDSLLYRLLK